MSFLIDHLKLVIAIYTSKCIIPCTVIAVFDLRNIAIYIAKGENEFRCVGVRKILLPLIRHTHTHVTYRNKTRRGIPTVIR